MKREIELRLQKITRLLEKKRKVEQQIETLLSGPWARPLPATFSLIVPVYRILQAEGGDGMMPGQLFIELRAEYTDYDIGRDQVMDALYDLAAKKRLVMRGENGAYKARRGGVRLQDNRIDV
jgi:hypothetical protein